MLVYVAIEGEYHSMCPLGVFDSLKKAQDCVDNSKPSYNTSVEIYETSTGEGIGFCNFSNMFGWDTEITHRKVGK